MSIKQAIEEPSEVVDQVCDAMIQAWTLGQYYRGYSEANPHGSKAEETHTKFVALLDKTRAALAALRSMPQGEPVATLWVQMETHDMGQSLAPNPPFKAAKARAHAVAEDLPLGEYLLFATPHTEAVQPDRSEKIPLLIPSNPGELTEAVRMSEAEMDKLYYEYSFNNNAAEMPGIDWRRGFIRAVEQATAARLGVKWGDV